MQNGYWRESPPFRKLSAAGWNLGDAMELLNSACSQEAWGGCKLVWSLMHPGRFWELNFSPLLASWLLFLENSWTVRRFDAVNSAEFLGRSDAVSKPGDTRRKGVI